MYVAFECNTTNPFASTAAHPISSGFFVCGSSRILWERMGFSFSFEVSAEGNDGWMDGWEGREIHHAGVESPVVVVKGVKVSNNETPLVA